METQFHGRALPSMSEILGSIQSTANQVKAPQEPSTWTRPEKGGLCPDLLLLLGFFANLGEITPAEMFPKPPKDKATKAEGWV